MNTVFARFPTLLLLSLASSSAALGEESQFYGLLRMRDLTPFGFLRLDMRPAHAVTIEQGTWAFEFELASQNTWALSSGVESYLTTREAQGRHALGLADVQTIRDLPGENYLLDFEASTLNAIVHYKFTDEWAGYLMLSGVSYRGGFLDGTIETFHDTFGFSSFGRPAVQKNDINVIYDLKSAQVVRLNAPTDSGLTDPALGVRYAGFRLPQRWTLSIEAAIKIPVHGTRMLLSTGHYDYGLQASLQRRADHHALYANIAAVYDGGTDFPIPQDAQVIPTLILGYERPLTERTNFNVQIYVSPSAYSHDQTDLDELTGTKYQYSFGLRHRISHCLLTIGVTENVQNINNTPDIGFQFGFAYVPHPKPRS